MVTWPPEARSLAPVRFDGTGWRPATTLDSQPLLDHISVLTLNTWFGEGSRNERLRALLGLIRDRQPDVVLLQEVIPDLLEMLRLDAWVREAYQMPERSRRLLDPAGYGVMVLTRLPVRRFVYEALPSGMGRALLVAELEPDVAVGTVHLESLEPFRAERMVQLSTCKARLAGYPTALLGGDFNFDPADPEENGITSPWTDAWALRHPLDPGYTYDSLVNQLVRQRPVPKRVRYDRVLVTDGTRRWKVRSIERIGVEPLREGVWLSDHFGLFAQLVRG